MRSESTSALGQPSETMPTFFASGTERTLGVADVTMAAPLHCKRALRYKKRWRVGQPLTRRQLSPRGRSSVRGLPLDLFCRKDFDDDVAGLQRFRLLFPEAVGIAGAIDPQALAAACQRVERAADLLWAHRPLDQLYAAADRGEIGEVVGNVCSLCASGEQ